MDIKTQTKQKNTVQSTTWLQLFVTKRRPRTVHFSSATLAKCHYKMPPIRSSRVHIGSYPDFQGTRHLGRLLHWGRKYGTAPFHQSACSELSEVSFLTDRTHSSHYFDLALQPIHSIAGYETWQTTLAAPSRSATFTPIRRNSYLRSRPSSPKSRTCEFAPCSQEPTDTHTLFTSQHTKQPSEPQESPSRTI